MPSASRQLSIQPGAMLYGFLVGLSLERGDLKYSKANPGKMYARFEQGSETSTYLVPDWELFTLLSTHLCDNARTRVQTGNYKSQELWIKKTSEGWSVYVPPPEIA